MPFFPKGVQNIIYGYDPRYKLLDWIDEDRILEKNFKWLLSNPHAINIIEKYLNKYPNIIDRFSNGEGWIHLSKNYNAVHILEKNIKKVNWSMASSRLPIWFLEKHPKKIRYNWMSENEFAYEIIKNNLPYYKKSCRTYMNPVVYHLLDEDDIKHNLWWVSRNPKAIDFLKKNKDLIIWEWLLCNKNGIDLIKEEMKKGPINKINRYHIKGNSLRYDYRYLSLNENNEAIEILKNNQHLIYYDWFAANKSIFKKINYLEHDFFSSEKMDTYRESPCLRLYLIPEY